jgi:hypothetical protein
VQDVSRLLPVPEQDNDHASISLDFRQLLRGILTMRASRSSSASVSPVFRQPLLQSADRAGRLPTSRPQSLWTLPVKDGSSDALVMSIYGQILRYHDLEPYHALTWTSLEAPVHGRTPASSHYPNQSSDRWVGAKGEDTASRDPIPWSADLRPRRGVLVPEDRLNRGAEVLRCWDVVVMWGRVDERIGCSTRSGRRCGIGEKVIDDASRGKKKK